MRGVESIVDEGLEERWVLRTFFFVLLSLFLVSLLASVAMV